MGAKAGATRQKAAVLGTLGLHWAHHTGEHNGPSPMQEQANQHIPAWHLGQPPQIAGSQALAGAVPPPTPPHPPLPAPGRQCPHPLHCRNLSCLLLEHGWLQGTTQQRWEGKDSGARPSKASHRACPEPMQAPQPAHPNTGIATLSWAHCVAGHGRPALCEVPKRCAPPGMPPNAPA